MAAWQAAAAAPALNLTTPPGRPPPPPIRSGYGYSRNHGTQMHGLGAGVPVARVLAHFMGGAAEWETSTERLHTTVEIRIPQAGFVF